MIIAENTRSHVAVKTGICKRYRINLSTSGNFIYFPISVNFDIIMPRLRAFQIAYADKHRRENVAIHTEVEVFLIGEVFGIYLFAKLHILSISKDLKESLGSKSVLRIRRSIIFSLNL